MKLEILVNGDNAAFYDENNAVNPAEFQRILKKISDSIGRYISDIHDPVTAREWDIRDVNGNRCGFWRVSS